RVVEQLHPGLHAAGVELSVMRFPSKPEIRRVLDWFQSAYGFAPEYGERRIHGLRAVYLKAPWSEMRLAGRSLGVWFGLWFSSGAPDSAPSLFAGEVRSWLDSTDHRVRLAGIAASSKLAQEGAGHANARGEDRLDVAARGIQSVVGV